MRGVFSFSGTEVVGEGSLFFCLFWLLLGALCILGVLALLVISLVVCTRLGFQRCASCCTRPVGGFGGGIIFVIPGEFAGQHKKLPVKSVVCSEVSMVSS